ncbi:hypothetical protein BHE74_00017308 [Ensete ventricosum]|nr:hypothetical protein BHE74_00017308 [Ensete ventricosum]
MVIDFVQKVARDVEFRSVFHAPSRKFKILAIPNVLAHGKSYEHGFAIQCDGHILCVMLIFDPFMHRLCDSKYWPFSMYYPKGSLTRDVEFRSVFRPPSRKFKILAIPNVLADGKPYENGFAKKHDGHKLCAKSHAKSSFDQFFMYRLRNSKNWTSMVS